jgi:transposase
MDVAVGQEGDTERLETLIRREKKAVQRDRLRAVRLALDGKETLEIARSLGRSRRFVQNWVYAYRDGGIEALRPGKSGGRPTKLPREKEHLFKQRIKVGPTEADGGVCTLRGEDIRRILEREFGVSYTLDGILTCCIG